MTEWALVLGFKCDFLPIDLTQKTPVGISHYHALAVNLPLQLVIESIMKTENLSFISTFHLLVGPYYQASLIIVNAEFAYQPIFKRSIIVQ